LFCNDVVWCTIEIFLIGQRSCLDRVLNDLYDDDGYVMPVNSVAQASVTTPQRLLWELPPMLEQTIDRALAFCRTVRFHTF